MEIDQIPAAISKFIDAANKPDPEAFVNCFSEDAVVLDEGKKRIGQKAIKKWSDQYHFGANVTLEPKAVKENKDEVVVTCKLDGTYDKTGLPDPLLLEYHFSIVDDKIVSLSIF
ncbi:nuclear transport factor 2 family protein [Paenibacillus sp. IHBB 3054]|uniref:nuclear transport factor 2 family protein n=1 Tax=Paenibacillus sp. IHBB 3054 TaxID=3425689 RepID=UPI003F6782A4